MAAGLAGHEPDFYPYVTDSKWLGADYSVLKRGAAVLIQRPGAAGVCAGGREVEGAGAWRRGGGVEAVGGRWVD